MKYTIAFITSLLAACSASAQNPILRNYFTTNANPSASGVNTNAFVASASGSATNVNLYGVTISSNILAKQIILPTFNSPSAGFRLKSYNGGYPDDTVQIGYNLSDILYFPQTNTEPQIWMGFESSYQNAIARDPAFGTNLTSELYLRYQGIGKTGSGYVEPLFFGVDRVSDKIIRGDIRAERVTIANTLTYSYAEFLKTQTVFYPSANGVTNPVVAIGAVIDPSITLSIATPTPFLAMQPTVNANASKLRFYSGGGGVFDIGVGGNTAFTMFSSGGSAYECAVRNTALTPINFGHASVEMTLYTNGNLGVAYTTPTERLDVNGNIRASGTNISSATRSTNYFSADNSLGISTNLPLYTVVSNNVVVTNSITTKNGLITATNISSTASLLATNQILAGTNVTITYSNNLPVVNVNASSSGGSGGLADGGSITNITHYGSQYFPLAVNQYDASGTNMMYLSLTGNVMSVWYCTNTTAGLTWTFNSTNRQTTQPTNMVSKTWRIKTEANTEYTVAFNTNWHWMGPKPTAFKSNSVLYLNLRCYGTNESDVDATFLDEFK
jgi:hypothetical protein